MTMQKRIRKIVEYYDHCTKCKQEISGFSEKAVNYKMKLHIESAHSEESKNKL